MENLTPVLLVFSGIDPPDADKEKTGIQALQIKERDVSHSVIYSAALIILELCYTCFHFML